MSNYNTLLNHIEYKLGNTTNLNTNSDSNFYETQIKKNLPYFQNQRIKNLEKEISNGNNLYSTSYNLKSNFPNKTYGSGNLNIETFDTKNRKSMEREMEPYLNKMKSELNFLMENFRNEIGNCSNIQPQLNSLEEKIEDNKKMINIYQEDNIKKISSFENKINFLNLEIEKLNNKFTDMNKKVLEFQEVDYKIKEMTFQVNDIQTKTNNYDMTNADLYNKIQDQLLKVIENQLNNFNNEFQNLKNRNEDFNKKVFDLDHKYNNVHNMNLNIHNENIENKKELSNLQIENSNLKILFSNGIKQIESVTDNYNDLKNEINTNYKSKMNKLNEEIAENQMYFKNIGEDLKKEIQIINELNEKLLNSHSQISLLKDQIIQIDLSSKAQKDRLERLINQNNDKFNDMQNTFTSSLNNTKNELEQNFEIFKDETKGKIDSLNNQMLEHKYKKNIQIQPSIQTSNMSEQQIKNFIPQQTQFNEIIEKAINQYKKELDELKEDVKNHENNFESIDHNFKLIDEGIEQIKSFPEVINTLKNNQNTLRNDVQNGFNETTKWENEMNERINKTVEDLKKEINNNLRVIQIQNSMNNANSIPSMRDLSSPDIMNNLIKLEDDVRNQEKIINDLKSTLANKVDLNRVNGRCDLIDKKIYNLENDINSIKSFITEIPNSYEERNINKKISFSERNNLINDNIVSSNIINSNIINTDNNNNIINNNNKINKFQENLPSLRQSSNYYNEGIQESIYPHGYINNLIDGTKLENINSEEKQIETININHNLKGNQNYSSENDIEKYDNKPRNTDKYNKNELYKTNSQDLNANDFGNNKYLKYYICVEGGNIEVNKGTEFDKNKKNNNNNMNNYNNEEFNKKSIEKDDYDIYLDNIIQQNKENNDDEENNNFNNNYEDNNNENLGFVEKPNNVNGNDLDDDFDF